MQPALLAADADEYSVTRSLEAYLLWLFGYIMFNNTHGNSVDRILLPYAREIADGDEDVPPYSWGEAVLAATYRGLCDGCMKTHGNAILSGCPLLLQLWSYERLAVGRPFVQYEDSHGSSQASSSFPCPSTMHGPTSQFFPSAGNVHISSN